MTSRPPDALSIRDAVSADRSHLIQAIVELQDHERALHDTRLPGPSIAETYLCWLEAGTAERGAILVAEIDGGFRGFAAGWIELTDAVPETPDSNHFGYIPDICVLSRHRGNRIATRLLAAVEQRLAAFGITRLRINSLAMNKPARASYERSGFSPFEVMYEKRIG